ncbi:hypothetical protein J3D43_004780 [Paenibacillus xylanexedens]|uniref:hypothetical protein n=1 Tax=Paenibacillus xylanexedens TaxID=528191 RepID=UPI0020A1E9B1|nr:hypothetical protein [Paenibacillus xylanexedens]MCP1426264.1 hypothetical protein [Paenibacillus xylanexedens]
MYKDKPLTKEHVFPDFLFKKDPDYGFGYNGGAGKYTLSADQIKDVCQDCNNVILSKLDSYGKDLCDKYFDSFIHTQPITFEYDYNLLLRWILKISYNAARAYKTSTVEFESYIPYILGEENNPKLYTLLLGNVMKVSTYNGEEFPPNIFAATYLFPLDGARSPELFRMVYIRSYMFIIIGWEKSKNVFERQKQLDSYISQTGASVIGSNEGKYLFDPSKSQFDYLKYRSDQIKMDPRRQLSRKELNEFSMRNNNLKEIPYID